uniref:Uncharacterized protein n=1 Tax=Pithovirus LCPAC101 TaxID=2506586 RepID=A0A481Z5Q8_9VIRU|nr:MAG: hypothetical protein LCPAC101_02630 [Pithovirus LCPAC101]
MISSENFCSFILYLSNNESHIEKINKHALYIGYYAICKYGKRQYIVDDDENSDSDSELYSKSNNKTHFLALCNDLSYSYIYSYCVKPYYYTRERGDDRVDLKFVMNMKFDHNLNTFLKIITINKNTNYRLIQKFYTSIYCQKEHTLNYVKNTLLNDCTISSGAIDEIVRSDWLEAIIWLMKHNHLTITKLIKRWLFIKEYRIDYWNILERHFKQIVIKYEHTLDCLDINYIYILFPDINLKNNKKRNNIKSILLLLDDMNLAYLLGISIDVSSVRINKSILNKHLNKLVSKGYNKYYDELELFRKTKLSKFDIKNIENTLCENIYTYSPLDLILHHTNNISHAFTRVEYINMNRKKNFINYYTKHELSYLLESDIKRRLDIALHYKLPDSIPLKKLYEYYMSGGVIHNLIQHTKIDTLLLKDVIKSSIDIKELLPYRQEQIDNLIANHNIPSRFPHRLNNNHGDIPQISPYDELPSRFPVELPDDLIDSIYRMYTSIGLSEEDL